MFVILCTINFQNEAQITPKRHSMRSFKRRLLKTVRKQTDLTPKASNLYKIARNLLKRKTYTDLQNSNLRTMLRADKRLQTSTFIQQYERLSEPQRLLIQMQLRTAQQPRHVCTNINKILIYITFIIERYQ